MLLAVVTYDKQINSTEESKQKKVKRSRYAPYRRIWVTGGIAPTLS
jgi:hypothetical protein